MNKIEINKLPSNRSFGLLFFGVLSIISIILYYKQAYQIGSIFFFLGLSFLYFSFFFSQVLTPLNYLWARFGLLLHKIITPIILATIFFSVFTPIGLLMRLLSGPSAMKTFDRKISTYWIKRTPPGPEPKSLEEQF